MNNEAPEINFQISKTTAILLEKFRQVLGRITDQPNITIADTVGFIVEDYTKSFYANLYDKVR